MMWNQDQQFLYTTSNIHIALQEKVFFVRNTFGNPQRQKFNKSLTWSGPVLGMIRLFIQI